ncbi:DUF6268 family outer membrane beta-barrel protein [Aureisphaera galaxeae]|uniref:DUF6268 family outer membrane beta-barrel protein n=1 Tax=Aureisphaera galaxeae TaxID=1538023 RepID=UPI0023509054|nr:DUF6268 family outer membrane beta-barrel protein [Aureisphaera galaxeae]MDC8002539.1 DUF6268 family outer membrane beta-barrel protein [Aureisphaera galaxeae]
MKRLLLLALLLTNCLYAQNYVDLLKVGYGQTFNNDFEGTDNSTETKTFEVDLTFPVVLNDNHAIITGGLFSRNNLQLFPEAEFTSLYSSTLKIGWAATWDEKWSTTLVALPKIASDYEDIDGDDFYFGGIALLKYQKKENLIYRFGLYASSEAFGVFSTPIFGWYYLSPNSQFEMDVSLPVSADINYTQGIFTYGVDYIGIGRSFNIDGNNSNTYADLSSLEFASYLQFNALDKSILLRAKLGYSSNDFEIYQQGEKIDLGVAAFSFGDDRTQLNPTIQGGFFLRFEAIYRFNLPQKETDPEKL